MSFAFALVRLGRAGRKTHIGILANKTWFSFCESGTYGGWKPVYPLIFKGVVDVTCEKCQKRFGKTVSLDRLNNSIKEVQQQ